VCTADDIEVEEDHELEGAEILGGDDGEDEDYATAVFVSGGNHGYT
jgi:hypothetical protein